MPESQQPKISEAQICAAIAASDLFDPKWYLEAYPDVAASGLDPVVHYVRFGEKEGRKPAKNKEVWVRYESQASGSGNLLYDYILQIRRKTNRDTIPIVFACNEKYSPYLSVAISSLESNSNPHRDYTIYIFYNNMDVATRKCIGKQQTKNVHIEFVWIGKYVGKILEDAHVSHHISVETYFRILIPILLRDYEKCIYLDCDIIVNGDIAKLYDLDIGKSYIAGAKELWMSAGDRDYALAMHPKPVKFYFNAGIVVININQFLKHNLFDAFMAEVSSGRRYPTWDQDILNIITREHIYPLENTWNFTWLQYADGCYSHLDTKSLCSFSRNFYNPAIVHYNSGKKPWDYNDNHFAAFFWHYARLSPFYNYLKSHSAYATDTILAQLELHYNIAISNTVTPARTTSVHYGKQALNLAPKIMPLPDKNHHEYLCEKDIFTENISTLKYQETIPIVFAINQSYVSYLSVALVSLIEKVDLMRIYEVYILYHDIDTNSLNILCSLSTPNVKINVIKVTSCIHDILTYGSVRDHVTLETYFRILIPSLLPQFDKVIYLDCDIIITTDISSLYDIDLEGFAIGAINDYVFDKEFLNKVLAVRQKYLPHYFNAGVLLMNNRVFKNRNLDVKFMEYLKNGIKYVCQDQDILNMVCEGMIKTLPVKWNLCLAPLIWNRYEQARDVDLLSYIEGFKNPAIIHYNGSLKPTDTDDGYFIPLFWKIARKSPYFKELKRQAKVDVDKILEESSHTGAI